MESKTSPTIALPLLVIWFCCCFLAVSRAQEPATSSVTPKSAFAAARAMEASMVASIAKAEQSVVAIARGKNGMGSELQDPRFVPYEYSTGVVVGKEGLILTNYHSLGDVEKNDYVVWIKGKAYGSVVVKAADPWTDLAVLETNARNLTPIEFGDAAGLKKGRIVIALGNPHAIARDGNVSATWGIVSNLSRKVDGPLRGTNGPEAVNPAMRETRYHFGGLIQTDARLARGTSGGPLLDLDGKMIGLTTNVAMLAGFEKGTGYAIPVDTHFRRVLEKLKRGEEVEQGFLGVAPRNPVSEENEQGVILADVKLGTPASKGGMFAYDEVLQIDEHPVRNVDDLFLHIGSLPPNHVAKIRVRRSEQEKTLLVRLSKKPMRSSREKITTAEVPTWRGLQVDHSTSLSTLRISSLDPRGCVIVTAVQPESPAWIAGLRTGAIVSQVNGKRVTDPEEFQTAVAAASGPVSIGVFRQKVVIVEPQAAK